MKHTIVPAQVTTVEDKIAGNISFRQLLLLITPVFFGGLMFILLPPFMKYAGYKIAIWAVFASVFIILAIRIKGKLVIDWMLVKGRYNLRPTYYIFNKNDVASRSATELIAEDKEEVVHTKKRKVVAEEIDHSSLRKLEELLSGQGASLNFHATKKGGLHVSVTQNAE